MRKFLFSCTMLAAFGANAAADPFVSGSEPGWGKHLSPAQRRTMGFEDVPAALKAAGYDNDPQPRGVAGPGVPGFVFHVLTIRHAIHGHDGGSGGGSGGGGGGGDISGPNIETAAGRLIPPKAPPFQINQIRSEPFGVFATRQECDTARAIKIAELDAKGWRFPHQRPDAPTRTTTLPNGTLIQEHVPSTERNDVTYCEPGVYSPGSTPNIAKGKHEDTLPTRIALPVVQQDAVLEVAPGFVRHWVSLRPFTRVIPGTSEVIEVLSASGRELVFMVKPDIDLPPTTNILLVDDNGEVVANLKIVIPGKLNHELRQGPNGSQIYRKDNPNYVPPKEKK